MPWVSLLLLFVLAAGVVASRARVARRFARLESTRPARPRGSDGVLIGAGPITLDATGTRGALVLHGFNDTTQSIRELSESLHARGWTVRAPLLPQHGRTFAEMEERGDATEWISTARAEWNTLRGRCPDAVLVGQSMGGALATILAADAPPRALVLVAPYLAMGRLPSLLARVWPLWQFVAPLLFANPRRGYVDEAARAGSLGHGVFTPRLVNELRRVVRAASSALPRVDAPTLVLHARADYRIPSRSATRAFSRLAVPTRELVWFTNSGHVLAADAGRAEVIATVGEWLDRHVPAGPP